MEPTEPTMTRLTRDVACYILRTSDPQRQAFGNWAISASDNTLYCALAEIARVLGQDVASNSRTCPNGLTSKVRDDLDALGIPTSEIISLNDNDRRSYAQIADWLEAQPVIEDVKVGLTFDGDADPGSL